MFYRYAHIIRKCGSILDGQGKFELTILMFFSRIMEKQAAKHKPSMRIDWYVQPSSSPKKAQMYLRLCGS